MKGPSFWLVLILPRTGMPLGGQSRGLCLSALLLLGSRQQGWGCPLGRKQSLEQWGKAWEQHLCHSWPITDLVKASCAIMWRKTIAAHRIKAVQHLISFLGCVTLQLLTSFISSSCLWNSCPPLSHCFVPSGGCRVLSLKNCKYSVSL